GLHGVIKSKMIRTAGVGESVLGERIADLMGERNPTVGTMAHTGQVDVRIAAKAESEAEADALIAAMEQRVRERLGDWVFGVDGETLESIAARRLKDSNASLAIVETNTGGMVALRLSGAPHGVEVLRGAWIVTDREVASALMRLDTQPLASAESALHAASWAQRTSGATWGLSLMGTLGNEEHLYGQRTGECWIALVGPKVVEPEKFPYGGITEQSRTWIANRALDLLRRSVG
ncbi:MAG: CinA family protein, partial [Chloroflexi bacterium]|nr:CinA family protein [Chloroflexota bacterium]